MPLVHDENVAPCSQIGYSESRPYICPSSNQSPKCGSNNEPLDKGAAVLILSELLRTTWTPKLAYLY